MRLRGVVDEVATGLRATFRDEQELVNALLIAVAADRPGLSHDRVRERSSDDAHDLSGED